jgi:hypothetical protein
MSYSPDFGSVYTAVTSQQRLRNQTFASVNTDPVIRAQQVLDIEFNCARNTFTGSLNGQATRPKNQSESDFVATGSAYVHLFRYLSALYSLTESIELIIEQASGESNIDIRPPFPPVGGWNGTTGSLQPTGLNDEVLRPFLYLVGLRHVVTHATLDAFNLDCETDSHGDEHVVIEFSPSITDSDPAVQGVNDSTGSQRCFTDSYLRYEQNLNHVEHPIDYILHNHTKFILPFLSDMMNYI